MQGCSSSWFWLLELHTSLTFCQTEADERWPWPMTFNTYKLGCWIEKGLWQQTLGSTDFKKHFLSTVLCYENPCPLVIIGAENFSVLHCAKVLPALCY